jgi:uncharacterized membrane protein
MTGVIEATQKTAWRKSMHFPASVRKSRSFALGLGLQIAFAIFVGLAHPAPAAAGLKVCNNTKTKIMVAVSLTGMLDPSVWNAKTTTSGYTAIDAGECQVVVARSLYESTHIYLFAWQPSNPTRSWPGSDDYSVYQHCLPTTKTNPHFAYQDYEKSDPKAPCGAGQFRLGFFLVPTSGRSVFTEVLNEPTETTAPQQPNPPPATPAPGEVPPTAGSTLGGATAGIPKPGKAVLSTPSAPTGNAILSVTSGLTGQPGGSNPLAGHTFVLLNQSYEAILAGAGIQAPPGVSQVKGYLAACTNRQPACQVGVAATNSSTVSGARADASGKAQLPGVPPGTYYFVCLGAYNNQLFKWDFQVQLKSGTNSVTLDQHNAVLVN